MNTATLFNKIAKLRVFVIGDVMIDNYWFGYSDRMSPEAPVPIVTLQRKETRLGGAMNVSLNCSSLGAETYTLSVIGKDEEASRLLQVAQDNKLNTSYILQSEKRLTTSKSRVISSDKHLLRIDDEEKSPLPFKLEQQFIDHCLKAIQILKPDVIILQDYNKGVLTPSVIRNVISHAKEIGSIISVDPKHDNFFAYKGVDIFKPNLKEVKDALGLNELVPVKKNLCEVHASIQEKINHKVSFITLSEKGVFVQEGTSSNLIKAYKRNIVDVSGAGDTVIAVASLVYAATQDAKEMANVANLAGGLVCEEVGVVTITKKALKSELNKIMTP